jgi:TRAP-type C4-dicarboxylate transport system substrate-binding protein
MTIFFLAYFVLIAGALAKSETKYHFRYPSWESPGSWHNENFYLWWPKRVEELSNGQVKFDLHPGSTLIKGGNHYEAVRDGTVAFAPSATSYEKDTMPLPTVVELPFVFKDWPTWFKMKDEMLSAGLADYYKEHGVQYIAGCAVEPYGVWTTEKWGPIRKLEDLKGCKIRTPGGFLNDTLVAMGANPVSISVVDMYMSLQTGVIDGVSLAEASQISHRSHEVVKYASRVNYGCPGIHIIANLETWNNLPQDIKDIMTQAGQELLEHYGSAQKMYWKEKTPVILEEAGVELIEIAPEEKRRMIEATKTIRTKWQSQYGDLHNGLGNKLVEILDKYSAE